MRGHPPPIRVLLARYGAQSPPWPIRVSPTITTRFRAIRVDPFEPTRRPVAARGDPGPTGLASRARPGCATGGWGGRPCPPHARVQSLARPRRPAGDNHFAVRSYAHSCAVRPQSVGGPGPWLLAVTLPRRSKSPTSHQPDTCPAAGCSRTSHGGAIHPRVPRFARLAPGPIPFVLSIPARAAARPASPATPAHRDVHDIAPAPGWVAFASRVDRCRAAPSCAAFVGRGPSHRGSGPPGPASAPARSDSSRACRRAWAGPSWGWMPARVLVPPRQCPGGVRARVSVPPRLFPVWVRARVSVPPCQFPARPPAHGQRASQCTPPRRPDPPS